MEKFGVEYSSQANEVKEKSEKTCLEKYSKDHIFKTDKYRSDFNICKDLNYISYENGLNLFRCEKDHLFDLKYIFSHTICIKI